MINRLFYLITVNITVNGKQCLEIYSKLILPTKTLL